MKKILFILIAVITLKVTHAQTSSTALAGAWKFQDLKAEYPQNMQGKKLADAQKDVQGDIKKFKKNFPFIFTEDGHFTIGTHHGTWVMGEDGKTVTYTNEKKQKGTATILQLTEHQLIFSRVDDDITQTFTLTR
jgi:hypothetical protein